MSKAYTVNEIFYSLQGEGIRAGTPNIFIRFTGCNMECDLEPGPSSPGGFACDTEFRSGRRVTLDEMAEWCADSFEISVGSKLGANGFRSCERWLQPAIVLTGGEPGLQVDRGLINYFHERGCYLAIETNGSVELPPGLDWVTLSPKVAEHAVKQLTAHELKYVRGYGQGIPKSRATAGHKLISPAFDGGQVHPRTIEWCTRLCLENPEWRLSLQTHKFLKVR